MGKPKDPLVRAVARLIRTITTLGGVALLLWLMRDRMVRLPVASGERVPVFRTAPPDHEPPAPDVTAVVGIGPVYAERLAQAGIRTVADLVASDADALAAAAGVGPSVAAAWLERAVEDH